jgi:hypothetical protein
MYDVDDELQRLLEDDVELPDLSDTTYDTLDQRFPHQVDTVFDTLPETGGPGGVFQKKKTVFPSNKNRVFISIT